MKIKELLEFGKNKFKFKEQLGNKTIYEDQKDDEIILEIYSIDGKIKKLYWIESENGEIQKKIRIKITDSNEIELSIRYKNHEMVMINNDAYLDMKVIYSATYNEDGNIKKEEISICSNKKKQTLNLKKILGNTVNYFKQKNKVVEVETEYLSDFEKSSTDIVEALMNYTKRSLVKEVPHTPTVKDTKTEPEVITSPIAIPEELYIYDRVYEFQESSHNKLTYINNDTNIFRLEINLDHSQRKISELIFTTLTENPEIDKLKELMQVRLTPVTDNTIRGLYTVKEHETIKINHKNQENTKISGIATYDYKSGDLNLNLNIRLKNGNLKVWSKPMISCFENEKGEYLIESRSYVDFSGLVRLSPYMINNLEEKIWQKKHQI